MGQHACDVHIAVAQKYKLPLWAYTLANKNVNVKNPVMNRINSLRPSDAYMRR